MGNQLVCAHCGLSFDRAPWPNTKPQKYCSVRCNKNAWALRNREQILERSRNYARTYRSKRLATQRKYNNSPKGRASHDRYWTKNRERRTKEYLDKYHNDPTVRAVHQSRERARKLLARIRPDRRCELCGDSTKVHCHHRNENPLDNRPENLAWLCIPCHTNVHAEQLDE